MSDTLSPQDLLFLCEYIAIAWGVRYDGILIDRRGQLFRFGDKVGMDLPAYEPGQTRAEYLAWLCQHAVLESQVDPLELEQMAGLVEAAAQGEVVPGTPLLDSGVWYYRTIRLEEGQPVEVILATTGEQWETNQSPQAAVLVEWLKKVWGKAGV
jgi:hypothetical protein